MAEKRRGLGRGLGALISSSPAQQAGNQDPEQATEQESTPRKRPAGASGKLGTVAETLVQTPGGTRPSGRDLPDLKTPQAGAEGSKTGARSVRKARPVDMFFTPGKTEEEAAREAADETSHDSPPADDSSDEAPRHVAGRTAGKRAKMPDLMGRDRTGAQRDPQGSAGVEESVLLQADVPGAEDVQGSGEPTAVEVQDAEVSRETLVEVPGASFAELPVGSIHPNRKQPRHVFDEDHMAELVHSIKEVGLLQPIVVRPSTEDGEQSYELVMGERRWRATQAAGLDTIPAIIRDTQDVDLLRDALLENLHRSQLNPLEEAAAYQQLLEEFGCTQEELSERIGRSRPQISNTIRLMKLPALVQRRVAAGVLSAGHARALLGLGESAEMEKLAQKIVNEGLSVRATEEMVALSEGVRRPAREQKPKTSARHERLDFLATSLSDHLDTNVKITLGAKKGRVSIEFASVDDLNRIMAVISPNTNA
jgi:ParB family chromosome partitioning protein